MSLESLLKNYIQVFRKVILCLCNLRRPLGNSTIQDAHIYILYSCRAQFFLNDLALWHETWFLWKNSKRYYSMISISYTQHFT